MKKKEFAQSKTQQPEALKKSLLELKDKLWTLRVDLASGKVKNVREIRKVKTDIAQTLTLLNNRDTQNK